MLKKLFTTAAASTLRPWRTLATRHSSTTVSDAVDSIVLRSLREHYLEVSKMTPPPKISPPKEFSIMKGALDTDGPVLRRNYGEDEEITITVMRLLNNEEDEDHINQLFLHVDVAKPGKEDALHFLVGLYPDAMGIHSVSMRPKVETLEFNPSKYGGPDFHDLGERTRDALHEYIEERGVNDSLFTFLQAWLYVKDHRNLMRWFKTVGSIISEKPSSGK
ncbi:hypothetical protein ACHQM5_019761 [Ranunculus cassubicifolius]